MANTIAQFCREVPLDCSPESDESVEQLRDSQLSSGLDKKRAFDFDRVARLPLRIALPGTVVRS